MQSKDKNGLSQQAANQALRRTRASVHAQTSLSLFIFKAKLPVAQLDLRCPRGASNKLCDGLFWVLLELVDFEPRGPTPDVGLTKLTTDGCSLIQLLLLLLLLLLPPRILENTKKVIRKAYKTSIKSY